MSGAMSLRALKARRILTMNPARPVVDNGLVVYEDTPRKRITAVGTVKELGFAGPVEDMGDVVLAPGLINAHTHLELSHCRGKTLLGQGFTAWVKSLIAQPPHVLAAVTEEDLDLAAAESRECGVAHLGDVTSRNPGLTARAMTGAGLTWTLFAESLGYGPTPKDGLAWPKGAPESSTLDAPEEGCLVSAAGHALYSTSPQSLIAGKAWDRARGRPYSLHLAEHRGEVELLAHGRGEFADLLRNRLLPGDFAPPGLSPVRYADSLGLLDGSTLAVHCVHVDAFDVSLLAARGVTVCLCPRSNAAIGVGQAPLERLRQCGVKLCLATDSLASNADLNLWNEARFLLENSQSHITVSELVRWMTVNPAEVLGSSAFLGRFEPGKRACYSIVPDDILTHAGKGSGA